MRLLENKREIAAAVIGALIAGIISAIIGIYSLNKTFQLSQSKELLLGLRQDIALLMNVDREIDENIKLLLTQSYQLKVEFEPYQARIPQMGNRSDDKEAQKWMQDFFSEVMGKRYIVRSVVMPPEKFVIGAWPSSVPAGTDIDFELIQALQDLDRKLARANAYLEAMSTLAPGANIEEASKNAIERNFPRFNAAVADLSRDKLVQLKNKVAEEIKKLQRKKDEIVL